jgi:predicted transcriptional regulator
MSYKTKVVKPEDCIGMPDLSRDYYDPIQYKRLKHELQTNGWLPSYPAVGYWDEDSKKYVIVAGIHRLQIAKELHFNTIPLCVYAYHATTPSMPSNGRMILLGMKSNLLQAHYNTIDIAMHIKNVYQAGKPGPKEFVFPEKRIIGVDMTGNEIAKELGWSKSRVSEYLSLNDLPESIKEYVAEGKLKTKHAVLLARANDKGIDIEEVAHKCINGNWSAERLRYYLSKPDRNNQQFSFERCKCCKKEFPAYSLGQEMLCKDCSRSEQLFFEKIREYGNEQVERFLGTINLPSKEFMRDLRERIRKSYGFKQSQLATRVTDRGDKKTKETLDSSNRTPIIRLLE